MTRLLKLLRAENADVSILTELWAKRQDRWEEQGDYRGYDSYSSNGLRFYDETFKRAMALVAELAADHGKHMERWTEATFFCHLDLEKEEEEDDYDDDEDDGESEELAERLAAELLRPLKWSTPNLAKLHVDGVLQIPFINKKTEEEELSLLKELDVGDDYMRCIGRDTLLLESLERLTLREISCTCAIEALSELQLLQELTTSSSSYHDHAGVEPMCDLSFPHLRKLTLLNVGHLLSSVRLQTPTLEELYVQTSGEMPVLFIPTHLLIWEYTGDHGWEDDDSESDDSDSSEADEGVDTCMEVLDSAFEWLGIARRLIIHGISEEVISEYLDETELPDTLATVQTKSRNGRLTTLFSKSP